MKLCCFIPLFSIVFCGYVLVCWYENGEMAGQTYNRDRENATESFQAISRTHSIPEEWLQDIAIFRFLQHSLRCCVVIITTYKKNSK